MATKKSIRVLVGTLVIAAWILGCAIQAGAETMNYKSYVWMNKMETVPIDDVEGHVVILTQRGGFDVFENGEFATLKSVGINDLIKGSGSAMTYTTISFADGSTIMLKGQGTVKGTTAGRVASSESTSEIIKGTGRFEGIKGSVSGKTRNLPAEKGEAGPKQYGEGTITYTVPNK